MVDVVAAGAGGGQYVAAIQWDYPNGQIVAIGAGALASTAFAAGNTVVMITASSNCWYRVNGTAAAHTAGSDYLAAGQKFMLKIPPAATISVIQDSAAGFLAVMPARLTPL